MTDTDAQPDARFHFEVAHVRELPRLHRSVMGIVMPTGRTIPLIQLQKREFETAKEGSPGLEGLPTHYCWVSDLEIEVWPTPDREYAIGEIQQAR